MAYKGKSFIYLFGGLFIAEIFFFVALKLLFLIQSLFHKLVLELSAEAVGRSFLHYQLFC